MKNTYVSVGYGTVIMEETMCHLTVWGRCGTTVSRLGGLHRLSVVALLGVGVKAEGGGAGYVVHSTKASAGGATE